MAECGQSLKKPKCRCCADHICYARPGELDGYPRKPECPCEAHDSKNACNEKQLSALHAKIECEQGYGHVTLRESDLKKGARETESVQ